MKTPSRSLAGFALFALAAFALKADSPARPYAPLDYVPMGNRGQAIVDMEMARHPELKLITVHVTPQGVPAASDKDRCILCSSIGRIGKHDNDEDIGIYRDGTEKTEMATEFVKGVAAWSVTQAPKYEFITPLLDQSGEKVGLLVIVFGYKAGDETAKYDRIAHEIRDDFKQAVAAKDDLLAPAT
jgi:hypothetical protein